MRKAITSLMIASLPFLPMQGCEAPESRIITSQSTKAGPVAPPYLCDFGEATRTLDHVMSSSKPTIYVISESWCEPCRWLEEDLLRSMNGTRDVFIAHIEPGSQSMVDYAKGFHGAIFPSDAIPSVIITDYHGGTLFTQGYNGNRRGFDSAFRSDGRKTGSVTIEELFR